MVRTIIKPDKGYIKLDIPKEYVGKEIEVTYLPLNEVNKTSSKSTKTMKDFWGKLSDEQPRSFKNTWPKAEMNGNGIFN